ncbi:single-stranded DNA-binding protein [Streptomyces sp. SID7909]|uniref:single-stranded DNA-binding protein n=1 Tax=Streptomyces sp. SID7909 TaxID=2706092 RepID=UPI0013BAF226|nr:single-stranded DNA-binding protein [Streptomyces sp. SID7909]NEC10223.1 single-stranded DNA-binding protein [Streptomyces sp. SID7909]
MNETLVTLVGNAATAVEFRETASGGMARFRFAVTPRRWDRAKELWADGHTSFYTVWAWRTLAANLTGSVAVGEPLVVHGRLKVREEELEGQRRTFVDIEAVAVGHDLTRGTAAFRRVVRGEPGLTSRYGPAPVAAGADPWAVREAPERPVEEPVRPVEEPVGGREPVGGAEPSGEAPVRERPVRRRTVRQKDGAAPRKPDSDLVTA